MNFIYLFFISSIFSIYSSDMIPLLSIQSYTKYNQETYNLDNIPIDILKLIAEKIDTKNIPKARSLAKNFRYFFMTTEKYVKEYENLKHDTLLSKLQYINSICDHIPNFKACINALKDFNLIYKHDRSILQKLKPNAIEDLVNFMTFGIISPAFIYNGGIDVSNKFCKNININYSRIVLLPLLFTSIMSLLGISFAIIYGYFFIFLMEDLVGNDLLFNSFEGFPIFLALFIAPLILEGMLIASCWACYKTEKIELKDIV